jgi:hypothetical protein
MLRSQRILVACGLVGVAVLLHVSLCEWVFREGLPSETRENFRSYLQRPIAAWKHTADPTALTQVRGGAFTGVVSDTRIDPAIAVIFGVALPAGLVFTLAYLALGWRREGRVGRGLCPKCGYNRRGAAGRCPECGDASQVT